MRKSIECMFNQDLHCSCKWNTKKCTNLGNSLANKIHIHVLACVWHNLTNIYASHSTNFDESYNRLPFLTGLSWPQMACLCHELKEVHYVKLYINVCGNLLIHILKGMVKSGTTYLWFLCPYLGPMQDRSKEYHKEARKGSQQEIVKKPSEGYYAITFGSDKWTSIKFPYWAFSCVSFIDSILGFVVPCL